MAFPLKEIAKIVNGEIVGDQNLSIEGISSLFDAKKDSLSFLLDDKKKEAAEASPAKAFIVSQTVSLKKATIKVASPKNAMIKLLEFFDDFPKLKKEIHPSAVIGKECQIDPSVSMGANVVIGDKVIIGKGSQIFPNVVIYPLTEIGKNVIIHAGSVIGADGFGYFFDGEKQQKIKQLGKVVIEDEVEIGANVCIDRATLGKTIIKKGTKIDNLVQIGHNVAVGEDSIIVSQVGIGGSAKIGTRVTLGGQSGIRDHVNIEDEAIIAARSGVTKGIKKKSIVSGFPAISHTKELEITALKHRLPEIIKRLKRIEEKLS